MFVGMCISENGHRTNFMDMVYMPLLKVISTKDTLIMAKKKAKGNVIIKMVIGIVDNGSRMKKKGWASISIIIQVSNIKAHGPMIKNKALEFIPMHMVIGMKVIGRIISNKEKGKSSTMIIVYFRVSSRMICQTDRV